MPPSGRWLICVRALAGDVSGATHPSQARQVGRRGLAALGRLHAIGKLAVYEAPYDEAPGAADKWKRYRAEQADLLAAGRRGDAVLHHLKFVGVPDVASP